MEPLLQMINATATSLVLDILDTVQDVMIIINKDSKILWVNSTYCQAYNVERSKIIDRYLSEIEPNARVLDVLKTGKPVKNEGSHIYSLNIDVVADNAPLFHEGKLVGAISVFRNVMEVTKMNDELEYFKKLTADLEKKLDKSTVLPCTFHKIIGHSKKLMNVLYMANKIAKTEVPVLIRGESGVGKEGLADAIHLSSERANGEFVKINCAAIPEALLESELFGYEKGAFTGARTEGKIGKFEMADQGTILLDEIGDMSLAMQAKVLRAIQEKEIERVGGNKRIKVNTRIIAATNKDLREMIRNKTFREDLYYRINGVELILPPLRERKEDIPRLVRSFLSEMCKTNGKELAMSQAAIEVLQGYSWPGNIRELRNIIELIVAISPSGMIWADMLPASLTGGNPEEEVQISAQERESLPTHYYYQDGFYLKEIVEKVEKETIAAALLKTENNKSKAMSILGLSRRSFYQKIRKYNIGQ